MIKGRRRAEGQSKEEEKCKKAKGKWKGQRKTSGGNEEETGAKG